MTDRSIALVALAVSVVVGVSQIWSCRTAQRALDTSTDFGLVSAETEWAQSIEGFHSIDGQLRAWESQQGLARTGGQVDSTAELDAALIELDTPHEIRQLYHARQRHYDGLVRLAKAYEPFAERLGELRFDLPDRPRLPVATLPPLASVALPSVRCLFSVVESECLRLIRDGYLEIPETLTGEKGFLRGTGVETIAGRIPFALKRNRGGIVFDAVIHDSNQREVARIEESEARLLQPGYGFASDDVRLEVLAPDGIPALQVYIDEVGKRVVIGGRFYDPAGNPYIALPGRFITGGGMIFDAMLYRGRDGRYSGSVSLRKSPEVDQATAARQIRPWFKYVGESPSLDEESFRYVIQAIAELDAARTRAIQRQSEPEARKQFQ